MQTQQQQQPQQPSFPSQPTSSFIPVPTVTPQKPPSPKPQPIQPQQTAKPFQAPKKDDGQHAQLAGLLARGREDGLDTFGNSGNLRKIRASLGVSLLTLRYTRRKRFPQFEPSCDATDRVRREQPVWSTTAATTTAAKAK
jgi:hypothetical protein